MNEACIAPCDGVAGLASATSRQRNYDEDQPNQAKAYNGAQHKDDFGCVPFLNGDGRVLRQLRQLLLCVGKDRHVFESKLSCTSFAPWFLYGIEGRRSRVNVHPPCGCLDLDPCVCILVEERECATLLIKLPPRNSQHRLWPGTPWLSPRVQRRLRIAHNVPCGHIRGS